MKHLTGLEVVKANDGEYHYGICNDMGEIVADLAGFTNAEEIAHRFVDAINAYDKVGAQRDALVEVCEMTGVYLGLWPPAAKSMQARHYAELSKKITDTLALVEASQ